MPGQPQTRRRRARQAYYYLSAHLQLTDDQEVWLPASSIADSLGMTYDQADRALHDLECDGFVFRRDCGGECDGSPLGQCDGHYRLTEREPSWAE